MSVWTDEAIEILKAGWAKGDSVVEIGEALGGFSRGSVVGKAKRLNLGEHQTRTRERANRLRGSKGSLATDKPRPRNRKFFIAPKFPYRKAPEVVPQMEPEQKLEPLNLTIWQLSDSHTLTQCRWPTNDDVNALFYCGLPVDHEGCSWCRDHKRMAWQHSGVKVS